MSRILKLILILVLLAALASCQSEKGEDPSSNTSNSNISTANGVKSSEQESSSSYRASSGFSSTQGQRNWYYLDSTGAPMSYLATNSSWTGPETYLLVWASGGHPGENADAVRQWQAPQGGTIRITGNASDANPGCGDGVVVSINKNGQVLWQQTIENGNTSGFNYDLTTTVAVGERINFVINKRGDYYCDGTEFDPTITYANGQASPVRR